MEVMVSPRVITRLFAVIIVGLALAHLTGQVFHLYFGHDYVLGFVPLFNLDGERNIPALFTALLLYLCSMLLGLIAYAQKKAGALYRYWLGLAFIFLFLALDEAAELHEMLIGPLRLMLDPSGFFYLAWVIPYGIGLLVFCSCISGSSSDSPCEHGGCF